MLVRHHPGDEPFMSTRGNGFRSVALDEFGAFHMSHGKVATEPEVYPQLPRVAPLVLDNCRPSATTKCIAVRFVDEVSASPPP